MAMIAQHLDLLDDINFDPKDPSGEQTWHVFGVDSTDGIDREDFDDVVQKVLDVSPTYLIFPVPNVDSAIPNSLLGRIHRLACKPKWIKDNEAEVVVSYGHLDKIPHQSIGGENPTKNPEDGGQGENELYGPEWDFDLALSSTHITQLDETLLGGRKRMERKFAKTITPIGVVAAPHLGGAIGISRGKIQGVDIGAERATITLSMKGIPVTPNYRRYLRGMLGCINSDRVFGMEPEEMMFVAAKLRHASGEGWSGTFSFAEGENLTNVRIGGDSAGNGGVVIPEKKAFDYVWCTYREVKEEDTLVQRPASVYVDRLYFPAPFEGLFIGTL